MKYLNQFINAAQNPFNAKQLLLNNLCENTAKAVSNNSYTCFEKAANQRLSTYPHALAIAVSLASFQS